MKNKDIYDLYEGLYEISQNKDLKFPIKTSYILAKTKFILEPYYNAIGEAKTRLLNKYGQPESDGWKVPKEKVEEFTKEWDEFMNIDNFITLQKITLKELENEKFGIELMEKLLNLIDIENA